MRSILLLLFIFWEPCLAQKQLSTLTESKTFPHSAFDITQGGIKKASHFSPRDFKENSQKDFHELTFKGFSAADLHPDGNDYKIRTEKSSGQIYSIYSSFRKERERFYFTTDGLLDSVTNCSLRTESIWFGLSSRDEAQCTTITKRMCSSFRLAIGNDKSLTQVQEKINQCKELADNLEGVQTEVNTQIYKDMSRRDFDYIQKHSPSHVKLKPYSFSYAINANSLLAYSRLVNLCTQYFSDEVRLATAPGGTTGREVSR